MVPPQCPHHLNESDLYDAGRAPRRRIRPNTKNIINATRTIATIGKTIETMVPRKETQRDPRRRQLRWPPGQRDPGQHRDHLLRACGLLRIRWDPADPARPAVRPCGRCGRSHRRDPGLLPLLRLNDRFESDFFDRYWRGHPLRSALTFLIPLWTCESEIR